MNEFENNLNKVIENQMDNLESKVRAEVMAELEAKGIQVVPSVYDGEKEVLKVIDKFEKELEVYNKEKERIAGRYAEKVKAEKLAELNEKMNLTRGATGEELDSIFNKQVHWRQEAIKNKMLNPEYRANRQDIMNTFIALKGIDLEADLVAELVSPIAEVKDKTTLRLIQKLVGDKTANGFMLQRTIETVDNYINDAQLKSFISQAKSYFNTGEQSYTYKVFMHNHKNK